MNITAEQLADIIDETFGNLYHHDNELLDRGLKEEAVNHRFAYYLENILRAHPALVDLVFYVDLEFNKMNGDEAKTFVDANGITKRIRPDIIVHQRSGPLARNFIVFECKKSVFSVYDVQKVAGMMQQALNYQYGVLINYGMGKNLFQFRIYQEGNEVIRRSIDKQ